MDDKTHNYSLIQYFRLTFHSGTNLSQAFSSARGTTGRAGFAGL